MTVTIRPAVAADAAWVSYLNADVQALHAAALPFRFKPPGPDSFSPAEAEAVIAGPNNLVFLAEADAVPVGYAYAEIIRQVETRHRHPVETVYLHHISVRPQARRYGIGTALVRAIRAAGKERGIPLMTLDVWTFNAAARAFFAREGFVPYTERLWRGTGE